MPLARTTSPSRRACTGPQGGVNVGAVAVMLLIYQKPEEDRRGVHRSLRDQVM
jgi:hypothetical protein